LVLVVGRNGAGKTNLLESLHVGTQGFSPRTRSDGQIVRFGAETARVSVQGARAARRLETEVTLMAHEGKRALLNGARLRAAEQLRTELQTLVFTPDRLTVVKGAPAVRRAYFDRALGRLAPARTALPAEYGAAVGQRNAALRRIAGGLSSKETLAPWTERVAVLGRDLTEARREAVGALAGPFETLAGGLGLEGGRLVYDAEAPTVTDLEARLWRDLERRTTSLGPHRDDVGILAGARDLRNFGSQGEQRIAVLSLLLAESALIEDRRSAPPLLLLDDVLSELDEGRRRALLEQLPEAGQTIVTATAVAALPAGVAPTLIAEVSPGTVRVA
jgi:DNA replication and repair protein RecF